MSRRDAVPPRLPPNHDAEPGEPGEVPSTLPSSTPSSPSRPLALMALSAALGPLDCDGPPGTLAVSPPREWTLRRAAGAAASLLIPMSSAPSSIHPVQDGEQLPPRVLVPLPGPGNDLASATSTLPPAAPCLPPQDFPPLAPPVSRRPSLEYELAPALEIQQEPVTSRKRRASSPRWQTVTRRRRPNNGAPRREAAVGTADRTPADFTFAPPTNAWAARSTAAHADQPQMVASTSRLPPQDPVVDSAHRVRTPPPPHLDDEDYLDLAAEPNPQAQPGQGGYENPAAMDVDPPEVAVPPNASAGLGLSHPSTSTLDVPLRHLTATEPLVRQFQVQTPRQRQDVFYRDPAPLPRYPLPPPPIEGPYTVRDVVPRTDASRPGGGRAARGASPAPQRQHGTRAQVAHRGPLMDITEEVAPRDPRDTADDSENVPPPYFSNARPRQDPVPGDRDRHPPYLDLRSLDTHAASSSQQIPRPRDAPYGLNPGARSLDDSIHAPHASSRTAPQRGTVPPRNLTIQAVRQSMQEPREGYPLIRFNDHDGHVRGTHPGTLAEVRTSTSPVLAVHFPGVTALPPSGMVTNVNRRMVAAFGEEFGENQIWVVPPRPDPNAAPGDYEPRAWFLHGASPGLADELLRRLCVSTHIITFFVFPLDIRPDLILSLGGFASNIGFQIESMIRSTFEGVEIRNILAQQIAMNPRYDDFYGDSAVEYVLDSIDIEVITVDNTYAANVYFASPASSPANYRIMRHAIEQVPFVNSFNAPAQPVWFDCEICASNDHPTQACRYPSIPGWLGPVLQPPPPPQPAQFGPGSALTYRPNRQSQNPNGGANGRNGKGRGKGGAQFNVNPGPSFGGRGGGPGPSSGGASGYGRVF